MSIIDNVFAEKVAKWSREKPEEAKAWIQRVNESMNDPEKLTKLLEELYDDPEELQKMLDNIKEIFVK